MTARLVAEEGILKGLILPLEGGDQWIIGRDPDACQLLLEDPAASRKHLLCRKSREGIVLENLSKTNPVQVNNEELVTPRILQDGDTLKIGSGIFRFFLDLTPLNNSSGNDSVKTETQNIDEKTDSIFEENVDLSTKTDSQVDVNFDFLDIGRWLLKVIGGPNNGAEFSMQENSSFIIGTDPNTCDIVFHDTSVSRQHAKITINDDEEITIEDLNSRNGTLVDGQKINGKEVLSINTIVTTGTTSFVIYDREGNMQTIISPLLPSIVKVLQKDDGKEPEAKEKEESVPPVELPKEEVLPLPPEKNLAKFLLTVGLTSLFVLTGIGVYTLFRSEPVVVAQQANPDKVLADIFKNHPNIKYSFNGTTGRLFLVGHVLTAQDKNQLLYNLQGLNFIKSIDENGIIIDEYVWQEANLLLNKNPKWRGITIQSPTAGQFALSGYLQTRNEAEQLYEYISSNFPYLDRLEKRIIVDEDITMSIKNDLDQLGIRNVNVSFQNGDVQLTGGVAKDKQSAFNQLVEEIKQIPGVRNVRNQVNQIAPEQAMINISDKYEVTGFSLIGSRYSVIINGRIVTKGDILDGMQIKEIIPGTIFLERNGVNYRIDFSS
ncbi:putative type III secretion system protein SctD [Chlamydiales bacterium STE3]|nr:putative type III secretion system protein SctD [Chlamydiales bacterium STE3]